MREVKRQIYKLARQILHIRDQYSKLTANRMHVLTHTLEVEKALRKERTWGWTFKLKYCQSRAAAFHLVGKDRL